MIKEGDKVVIPYISDCNPHNGQVGEVASLRAVNYYPNKDYSVKKTRTSAVIAYPDGSSESVGDINRKGSGLISPIIKLK